MTIELSEYVIDAIADAVVKKMPEPFINKPCVSEQACREDKMKFLEKIKSIVAEWKADTWTDNLSYECMVKIAKLVEPQESEDKE